MGGVTNYNQKWMADKIQEIVDMPRNPHSLIASGVDEEASRGYARELQGTSKRYEKPASVLASKLRLARDDLWGLKRVDLREDLAQAANLLDRLAAQQSSGGTQAKQYPDRYVVTGVVLEGEYEGRRVWLAQDGDSQLWTLEKSWALRFETQESAKVAIDQAPMGYPWYHAVDPASVTTEAVPAIVDVY